MDKHKNAYNHGFVLIGGEKRPKNYMIGLEGLGVHTKKKEFKKCQDCNALVRGAKKRCGPCSFDIIAKRNRENKLRKEAQI